ncbi:LysR family transcriptional regulator [Ramlibacter sp. G-1-2-2]|uniref:LysR family transcriptional regulator n=1 Tax=Ramlibacter agri TaxID=2728837 RepID=A0A848GXF6_9BURK|nr:LysR family transcriptional regulator [Ramlibacter agri]NML43275.1 LysR family transcriptional regulator [Ramlibacter agri]
MSSRLDILGVQAFVAIAELGTFRRAASHLHLSESALGRRLKKLEDDLGVRLLLRTTRAVSLSQEGAEFLPRARAVVHDLAASLDSLRSPGGNPTGTVRIGCLPTVAALLLSPLLRDFAEAYPQVRVQIFDRSATEIREAVLNGEVDFAITVAGQPHAKLVAEKLFSEPMVVACPAGHRLAKRKFVTWAQLGKEALISIGNQSANRALIEDLVRGQSLQLSWAYQVEHLATAVSLVAGGRGVAILPRAAVAERKDESIRVLALREPVLKRDVVLLSRRLPMSSIASLFARLVRRELPALEGQGRARSA